MYMCTCTSLSCSVHCHCVRWQRGGCLRGPDGDQCSLRNHRSNLHCHRGEFINFCTIIYCFTFRFSGYNYLEFSGYHISIYMYTIILRKKQVRLNNKAKQHSTPKVVTFPKKMSCLGWDSNPLHYRQSWLGSNLTSHTVHVHVHVVCC